MDYLKYVNSKDIRNYLKEINYKPSSIEVAWLIHKSFKSTYEKHNGYKKLISEMPDMEINVQGLLYPHKDINIETRIYFDSLHRFLEKYMNLEKMLEGLVLSGGDGSVDPVYLYEDQAFSCLEDCMEELEKNYSDSDDIPFCPVVRMEPRTDKVEYIDFRIKGNGYDRIESVSFLKGNSELEIIYAVFGFMSPCFPVPFKKGDLVQPVNRYVGKEYVQPRVFIEICNSNNYSEAEVLAIRGKGRKRDLYERLEGYMNYEYVNPFIICKQRDEDLMNAVSSYAKFGSITTMLHEYVKWREEETKKMWTYDPKLPF